MKVKEKIYERRGRPRKYTPGEVRYRVLWAPENLLLELRIAARVRGVSMNDEVVGRLIQSLDFTPKKPIIKTEEGERLLALARLFDGFIQADLDMLRYKYAKQAAGVADKLHFVAGKIPRCSSSLPVNLKKEMEVSSRVNQRSRNQENVQRLVGSLNYFSEQQSPET